jgi:hypothetical protein
MPAGNYNACRREIRGRAQTGLPGDYSKLKFQNPLKNPKNTQGVSSHLCMKKLLLVASVLVGGVALSHAGVNVSIGLGFPAPRHSVVVTHPSYCPPPVYVAPCPPPVYVPPCPPRVIVSPRPVVRYERHYDYDYGYRRHGRIHDRWHDRHDRHGRHDGRHHR